MRFSPAPIRRKSELFFFFFSFRLLSLHRVLRTPSLAPCLPAPDHPRGLFPDKRVPLLMRETRTATYSVYIRKSQRGIFMDSGGKAQPNGNRKIARGAKPKHSGAVAAVVTLPLSIYSILGVCTLIFDSTQSFRVSRAANSFRAARRMRCTRKYVWSHSVCFPDIGQPVMKLFIDRQQPKVENFHSSTTHVT